MIVYNEFSSIASDLGIPLKLLFAVSNERDSHYRSVKLAKRDGSYRTLSVPDGVLKLIQRRIAERLLSREPISPYATAYKYGGGIRKNAEPHVGKRKILKLDISDFFDSIGYSLLKDKVFAAKRYAEPIRILLSILCYCRDVLPQGAPTSPPITNIIMRDFDNAVGDWCRRRGITYTRYCDDMTFSGDFEAGSVIRYVKIELAKRGFKLNHGKTAVVSSAQRQTVTGIVVNRKPNVPSEYRRKLRAEVYYIKKYGVAEHLKRTCPDAEETAYLQALLGRIAFCLSVRRTDAELIEARDYISRLLKEHLAFLSPKSQND